MKPGMIIGVALILGTFSVASARGNPIRFEFSGTIRDAGANPDLLPGEPLSGTFSYDPAENPPRPIMEEGFNVYDFGQVKSSTSNLTIQVGDRVLFQDTGHLQVGVAGMEYPGQFGDSGDPWSGVGIKDMTSGSIAALGFQNMQQWVLPSLDPPSSLSLSDFPESWFALDTIPNGPNFIQGTIDTLTVEAVPEPAGTTGACIALTGLIAWLRRCRPIAQPRA